MHELSLVHSLLELIDEQAAEHGFSRVNLVKLSCGRISGVEPQALKFAFSNTIPGTLCAGARLELDILPLKIHCFDCDREIYSNNADPTTCPDCGGSRVMVCSGFEELQLVELDVD
ncbi:MAG: hydrogenase maturation nickel metallochaperone HypA [Deltaproteobacteria bacterium]|nr:hydrogenase maturation nickel metallochaperone HypA [Deltaproteobacteria bacterium]